MNIFVKILIGLGILIAVLLIAALFAGKDYTIKSEITINKPKQQVFDYIKLLKNQDHYNVWVRKDPNMKKEFRGIDGTVGFVYAWDGNKEAGKGEQEITGIKEGENVNCELRFIKPFEGIALYRMTTESASGDQTKINWTFDSKMQYPMNLMLPFVKNMLMKDMQKSLADLKTELEKN